MNIYLIILLIISKTQQDSTPNGFSDNICICVTINSCSLTNGSNSTSSPMATTPSSGQASSDSTSPEYTSSTESEPEITPQTENNSRSTLEQNDGSLDMRIGVSGPQPQDNGNTVNPDVKPVWVGVKLGLEKCCTKVGSICGIRYPPPQGAPVSTGLGQSNFGEHPWSVDIRSSSNAFIGGGALIHQRHVLTAAHKVYYYATVKCRFGVWDRGSNSTAPFPIQEFTVPEQNIIIHPNFTSFKTLINDIAILRLPNPGVVLGINPAITPICLSSQPISQQRCWVAGWGKSDLSASSSYQMIMKEVNLPLISNADCQNNLRNTRLSSNFTLDSSFICAGGEPGNDACIGDGGGALSCSVNGRFYLVGLVAWGIGCGITNYPGVYVNVQNFIPWIQKTLPQLAQIEKASLGSGKN